ncbi:MAG: cytochrome c oxidase subunit [Acidobacteriaceae bacterium]|nr:cytochrome c oxidase subunit [Acidobacteriaceae bacterium]
MATTTHEPPRVERIGGSSGSGWRNLVPPATRNLRSVQDRSGEPAKTGVWVGLAAITMSFAAFTSAMVVRQGTAPDWRHLALPHILYLNTAILLASSVTLELSRRHIATYMGGLRLSAQYPARWLYITLFLGVLFVAGQYAAWLQLRSQGWYVATNPSSSFFYVFTWIHAMHVLGGLGGLVAVISKLRRGVLRRSTLDATSHYWHFMDALWLYLLFLLITKF